jgi:7,8-dihydropterin-6-yl-methyl-4-(beta-D-ribofuranosyl)aminobenzene 5'-phosphate synthase
MLEADSVKITLLVDNQIDMLLPDDQNVDRYGLVEHFDTRVPPPIAENGLSILIEATAGRQVTRVIFDAGLTSNGLMHNLATLGIDAQTLDYLVLSHGHPDHYGGIYGLLERRDTRLSVVTGADAFLPRFASMPDGRVSGNYSAALRPDTVESSGGSLIMCEDAISLGGGIYSSGRIPLATEFEGPAATAPWGSNGLWQLNTEHRLVVDPVAEEQAVFVAVNGGLIVLTGCAHRGVVNTIRRGRELFGDRDVLAVFGGFHLGFPTTPAANVDATYREFVQVGVQRVIPMHCSGLRSHIAFSAATGGPSYIQPAVGSVFSFS